MSISPHYGTLRRQGLCSDIKFSSLWVPKRRGLCSHIGVVIMRGKYMHIVKSLSSSEIPRRQGIRSQFLALLLESG